MINKNNARIRNTQKVLHKSGKNWITVSVVLLGLLGLGSAAGMTTHADATTTQTPVVAQNNTAHATTSRSTSNWKPYRSKMFVASNYPLYQNGWQKRGNTRKAFHKTFNVNGKMQSGNKTYYKLYNGKRYVGYTNANNMVKTNQSDYLAVPYVSQWRPISAPEGCAEASLEMLLRTDHKHVSLRYLYNHLPQARRMKGGQSGDAYGRTSFGHVIKHYALVKYAHRFDKNVKDISGSSVNQIKMYVQSGHPVLYYGYSSYQLPGDPNRNHCKVITAYSAKRNAFWVFDPLYYSKYGMPGTQGRNMRFDRGARFWYSLPMFAQEYAHYNGSNKKCALVLMGKPHYAHVSKTVSHKHVTKSHRHHVAKVLNSKRPSLSHYTAAEKALANKKYNYSVKVGRASKAGRETMASDQQIGTTFNKPNYEKDYLYALTHPALIDGAQDHLGGMTTGIKDGLNDDGQYAAVNAAKGYAKKHHEGRSWLSRNLNESNKHGFYFWYFTGFNDNNGGLDYNGAKAAAHQMGLTAYKQGLHEAQTVKNHKPSKAMLKYTMGHLSKTDTILSSEYEDLY